MLAGDMSEFTHVADAVPYAIWRKQHAAGAPDAVKGNLVVLPNVPSPQLGNTRNVVVYLPPSYAAGNNRYPVIYAQDGQNMFDGATGFAGQEWHADDTLENLALLGKEAMMVAVWNTERRANEYTPFTSRWTGEGEKYIDFLVNTLKPEIDRRFRTRPDRAHTGILGSSLGGLISAWAFFSRPQVFGFVGAFSPAFWPGGGEAYRMIAAAPFNPGKVYVDNGTREYGAKPIVEILQKKGYAANKTFRYVEEAGGQHNEAAWARRLPGALDFLL
jgi:predicted alpha/beta superfamily hydrolase